MYSVHTLKRRIRFFHYCPSGTISRTIGMLNTYVWNEEVLRTVYFHSFTKACYIVQVTIVRKTEAALTAKFEIDMIQTYHITLNVNKILSLTNLSGEEYVPIAIRTTTLGTLVTTSYYYEYVPIAIRTVQQEEQQKKRRRKRKKIKNFKTQINSALCLATWRISF